MVNKTVYLAGPISGLSFGEATDWRQLAKKTLADVGIKALSPLRAEVGLKNADSIKDSYTTEELENVYNLYREANQVMLHSRGITTRDRLDCTKCSVILVNLLGAKRVSIGTVMEIAWADANRIPLVVIMEAEGNLHDHAMVRECIGFRVTSVEAGLEVVKAILGDY